MKIPSKPISSLLATLQVHRSDRVLKNDTIYSSISSLVALRRLLVLLRAHLKSCMEESSTAAHELVALLLEPQSRPLLIEVQQVRSVPRAVEAQEVFDLHGRHLHHLLLHRRRARRLKLRRHVAEGQAAVGGPWLADARRGRLRFAHLPAIPFKSKSFRPFLADAEGHDLGIFETRKRRCQSHPKASFVEERPTLGPLKLAQRLLQVLKGRKSS